MWHKGTAIFMSGMVINMMSSMEWYEEMEKANKYSVCSDFPLKGLTVFMVVIVVFEVSSIRRD